MRRILGIAAVLALATALAGCMGGEEPVDDGADDCPHNATAMDNGTWTNDTNATHDCPPTNGTGANDTAPLYG